MLPIMNLSDIYELTYIGDLPIGPGVCTKKKSKLTY